jgi:hypothetical protein
MPLLSSECRGKACSFDSGEEEGAWIFPKQFQSPKKTTWRKCVLFVCAPPAKPRPLLKQTWGDASGASKHGMLAFLTMIAVIQNVWWHALHNPQELNNHINQYCSDLHLSLGGCFAGIAHQNASDLTGLRIGDKTQLWPPHHIYTIERPRTPKHAAFCSVVGFWFPLLKIADLGALLRKRMKSSS